MRVTETLAEFVTQVGAEDVSRQTFCLAVAAHEGPGALLPLSADLLGRADVVELAKRVELRLDPSLDARFPATVPGRVAVETARGRWERLVEHPVGDPANPMDLARMAVKFLRLTDRRWRGKSGRWRPRSRWTTAAGRCCGRSWRSP